MPRKAYAPIPTPPDPEPEPPPLNPVEALWAPREPAVPWSNRIVGYTADFPVDELIPNQLNFRLHGTFQKESFAGIVAMVGIVAPVTVNKRTGNLVNGHLRAAVAKELGVKTIPVTWVDLDEAEEALAIATLDPIAGLATTDRDNLAILLGRISPTNEGAIAMLVSVANEARLSVPQNILAAYAPVVLGENDDDLDLEDGDSAPPDRGTTKEPQGERADGAPASDDPEPRAAPAAKQTAASKMIETALAKTETKDHLWIGTRRVPMTADESAALGELAKDWLDRVSLRYGFVGWLVDLHGAGDDGATTDPANLEAAP